MLRRSRWLLILGFVIVALVCARLGFWQLSRLQERRAVNARALAARSAPVAILSGSARDSLLVNRRVRATGRYDHTHDIVIRGRPYRGVPGVELVSPLLLEDGKSAVLVNRGFLPAPDAVTIDPAAVEEPGTVTVEGIALLMDSGRGIPLEHRGRITYARLDYQALDNQLPYSLYPLYIRQSPDSALPRFPRRLELPPLDDGPHLTYTIQWFAFAILALVFAGIMSRRR